jgi:Pectate lyase superfamily protein
MYLIKASRRLVAFAISIPLVLLGIIASAAGQAPPKQPLARLRPRSHLSSSNVSIEALNLDGRFNVKNPIYGAKGDGRTDDTSAIQAAYNAACAFAVASNTGGNGSTGATVWFPAGIYPTSFSLISNCSQPITWKCESEGACKVRTASSVFPIIMHESARYLNAIKKQAPILATSLATGSGSAMNWGRDSQYYYDLKDAQDGFHPPWNTAKPLNGLSAFSVEGFLNYAGGGSGANYIMSSHGDDLNLANKGGAIDLYVTPGSPNKLAVCVNTSGNGYTCTAAGGTISTNTTYEFEVSYGGSEVRLFCGAPGSTTTLIGTAAMTGIVVQKPSEVFALGDGGGMIVGGQNGVGNEHWLGQLDSIRISNIARHTSTYTAPAAKFSNDSSTLLLMNNLAQSDVLLQVTNIRDGFSPVWIPIHWQGTTGGGGSNNAYGSFVNLYLQGGSYGILGENVLYTTLDHVTATGTHDSVKFEDISYGTRVEHLTTSGAPYYEAGTVFPHTNGNIDMTWLFSTGGYYGMELIDSGGQFNQLFMNPSSTSVADLDIGGSTVFTSDSIHELNVDFESGGTPIPAKIWGQGAFQFYGGDWQYDPSVNAIWVGLNSTNAGLALTLFGGQVDILGTPVNPLISWKGTGSPATPATWINPLVNGKPLSAATVPLSDNAAYAQALGDVTIPPVKTVATLPTCNAAAKGWQVQISDCNANCTTYLGTTFTGGGSTRSTVQCNGTAWELH